jgi:hypothetical protein
MTELVSFQFTPASGSALVLPWGPENTFPSTSAIRVNRYDLGGIPHTNLLTKAPFQRGKTWIDTDLEDRTISFDLSLIGATRDIVESLIQTVETAFNPVLGEGTLRVTTAAGTYRDIYAVLADDGLSFSSARDGKGKTLQKVTVELLCADPTFFDPSSVSTAFQAYISLPLFYLPTNSRNFVIPPTGGFVIAVVGSKQTLTNAGNVATPISVVMTGGLVNPRVTNYTTSEYLEVSTTITAAQQLAINTAFNSRTVTIDGVNAFQYVDLDSTFWYLQAGENLVGFSADSQSGTPTMTLVYNHRYIGV